MTESIWEPVSEVKIDAEDDAVLTNLLLTVLNNESNVGTAVGFTDQDRSGTDGLWSVAILDDRSTIVGYVYKHPGMVAVVKIKVMPPTERDGTGNSFEQLIKDYKEQHK